MEKNQWKVNFVPRISNDVKHFHGFLYKVTIYNQFYFTITELHIQSI